MTSIRKTIRTVDKQCDHCNHSYKHTYIWISSVDPGLRQFYRSTEGDIVADPNGDPYEGVLCPSCGHFIAAARNKYFRMGVRPTVTRLFASYRNEHVHSVAIHAFTLAFILFVVWVISGMQSDHVWVIVVASTCGLLLLMSRFWAMSDLEMALRPSVSQQGRADTQFLLANLGIVIPVVIVVVLLWKSGQSAPFASPEGWTSLVVLFGCLALYVVEAIASIVGRIAAVRPRVTSVAILAGTATVALAGSYWLRSSPIAYWWLVICCLLLFPIAAIAFGVICASRSYDTLARTLQTSSDDQLRAMFIMAYQEEFVVHSLETGMQDIVYRENLSLAFQRFRKLALGGLKWTMSSGTHTIFVGLAAIALSVFVGQGGHLPGESLSQQMNRDLTAMTRDWGAAIADVMKKSPLRPPTALTHRDQIAKELTTELPEVTQKVDLDDQVGSDDEATETRAEASATTDESLAGVREWVDTTGTMRAQATYLESDGAVVRLRKEDGREVTVKLERLSEADREYVRSREVRD